jgi:hypothetical protein
MSDEIFAQCVTLIGHAAIPKSLLAVPTPTEEDAGKVFSAGEDGSVGWTELKVLFPQPDWNQSDNMQLDYIKNKPSIATNDDSMDFLAEMGIITPVTNFAGEILISPSNEIYSL